MSRVDVLAVMEDCANALDTSAREFIGLSGCQFSPGLREARDAVAELIEKAERVIATLEMPTLVKASTKNENAGFIDMRDWYALLADIKAARASLARVGADA